MKVIHTIADARKARSKLDGLVLVPTMGALHAGHTSLMSIARRHGSNVGVSIFVNPTQFGQKDYQQLRVLSALVEALDWPIKIVPAPTVRDPDGMALSSRNQYLSPEERQRALSINRALRAAEEECKTYRQANRLITTMQK